MVPRPRFEEHEEPADFNPDHDVDFLNTRARHRDLVLRLKGAQGGATRDRPWRSEQGGAAPPAPTPAVERLRHSAPPQPRQFVRPSELPSETVESIRASVPARPRATAPSTPPWVAARQARAARLRGSSAGSRKDDDSLAQIRRSHREVEEDFAERRLRIAREERAARAADRRADEAHRRADEAHRRQVAADRRAAEEKERQKAKQKADAEAEAQAEAARQAAKREEKERRRLQVEAATQARRRREREEEAEAMRIWNEFSKRKSPTRGRWNADRNPNPRTRGCGSTDR